MQVDGIEENELFSVEAPLTQNPSTPQRKKRKAKGKTSRAEEFDSDSNSLDARYVPLFERESYAPDDLVAVSLPPPWKAPLGNAPFGKEFVYDPVAGKGSTVYVVDSGAYSLHPVSTLHSSEKHFSHRFLGSIDLTRVRALAVGASP